MQGLEEFAGLLAIIENLLETQFPTRGLTEAEEDEEEEDDPMLEGDDDKPRRPKPKPKPKAASAAAAASSAAASSASAEARRAVLSDSDSDDDLSLEAATAKQEAIEHAPRRFARYSLAMLGLGVGAFVTSEYKTPKAREDRLRKLGECYRALWELGATQLRRRLHDLGIKGEAIPQAKRQLVEAVYNRTILCHYILLETSGDSSLMPRPELRRHLGLEASDPILADDEGGAEEGDEGDGDVLEVGASARQRLLSGSLRGIKEELLREARSLSLPDNPLDELIHQLGGTEKVAELTGRKMKLVYDGDGRVQMVQRAKALDVTVARVNMAEKEAFMNGQKMIAIISEAASSGISLQVRLLSRLLPIASDCV